MKQDVARTNSMIPFPPIIIAALSWSKPMVIGAVSWLAGWMASVTVKAFQVSPMNQPVQTPWYENPAVVAGVVTGIFLIGGKILDNWWKKREAENAREDEEDSRHITFSQRIQELTLDERKNLLGELVKLHDRDVANLKEQAERDVRFWQREFGTKSKGEYEARLRAHAFANEVNRVHGYIHICHIEMAKAKVTIPDFKLTSYEEMMSGVEAQMLNFKDTLPERYDKAMQPDEEKK